MTDAEIRDALIKYRKIAVIGLSPKSHRASYGVSSYMQKSGYEINGVRPDGPPEILGRPCYPDLKSVPGPIEIVDVFRRSEEIPGVVDEVLAEMDRRPESERPKLLWLQLGITHPDAEDRARKRGLLVVSDKCILIEHRRLLG